MAMFIVSYIKDDDGVCCTNIAVAEDREQVEAHYGECAFIEITPAKCHEVEELRQRRCPVVECGEGHVVRTAQERIDAALDAIRWLSDNEAAYECGCAYKQVNIWEELEFIAAILKG